MVRVLTSVLLCVVCWSSTTGRAQQQNPKQFNEVDLRVKRVGLGSSHALVLRQLGRPISSQREKVVSDGTCGPSYTFMQLNYKGAVIELHGDLRGRNLEVVSMEITSPQLLMSPGIKIGMKEQEAVSKLGTQVEGSWELGLRILTYVTKGNDGVAVLYFRDDRLEKVYWKYILC